MRRIKRWYSATGILALLAMSSHPAPAQEPERQESAIGTRLRDFGGYLELNTRFGDMMGEFAAFAGGRAAVLFKQRVYLGLGGAGLATDNALVGGQPLRMGYGGILFGYVVPTRSFVQFTADVLVGAGEVHPEGVDQEDEIFVFEPTVGIELALSRVVRLGLGSGYRFVGDTELAGFEDADLRGFTGTVSIRAGWF
jgi:hypothetical protein